MELLDPSCADTCVFACILRQSAARVHSAAFITHHRQATILGDISLKLSEQMRLTVLQTQKDGPSPQEMATQALKEGADVVLVSGGDGTVGAVAGALVDTGWWGGEVEKVITCQPGGGPDKRGGMNK